MNKIKSKLENKSMLKKILYTQETLMTSFSSNSWTKEEMKVKIIEIYK